MAAVALAGCGLVPTQPGAAAAVRGMVVAAPGCPVERTDSPCPAFHVAGAIVVASRGDTKVTGVRSAQDGSFTLSLPAGTYTLTATAPGGYQSSASKVVDVPADGDVTVTITLDSGIRRPMSSLPGAGLPAG